MYNPIALSSTVIDSFCLIWCWQQGPSSRKDYIVDDSLTTFARTLSSIRWLDDASRLFGTSLFAHCLTPINHWSLRENSMARQSGIYSTLHGICVNIKNISQHNITIQHSTELVATNLNCVNMMENMVQHYKISFYPREIYINIVTKYPSTRKKYIPTLLQNIL